MVRDAAAERMEIDREIAGQTLCKVFAGTVERLGDAEALVAGTGADRRSWTWKMYREQVREVALGLRELGFARGELALLLARNRPEHVIGDLGVVHAGGTPVSAYTTLSGEQLVYIASHCEAKVAIVEDRAFADKLAALRGQLPHLQRVVVIEGGAMQPWEIAWEQLLATGRAAHARTPAAFDAMWREVQPDDTLTLIYTSGTTGHPKGVIDTHRNALWDLTSLRRMVATTEHDRVISYLPLAHAADRFLAYYQSLVGGHVLHFCPDLTQILALLTEVRPTFFGAVPRIWEKLHAGMLAAIGGEPDEQRRRMVLGALEVGRAVVACEQRGQPIPDDLRTKRAAVEPIFAAIRARVGLDQVRVTVTGAAPTPTEVIEFFHAIGLRISEVWGMSELGVIASINPLERIKIGSIGVLLPGIEGTIAPDGELLVRGGMVMRGYYKEPAKTAETIDADGWLATGDVATVDDEGYYTIVDRKKELIITAGGKNISPANLESLLKYHPLVAQACVIGDNRAYLVALIVLDPQVAPGWAAQRGIAGGIADLARHPVVQAEIARAVAGVNEKVSRVENIRRWTVLPTEWTIDGDELTPTMKLKRRVIHSMYAAEIEALYTG